MADQVTFSRNLEHSLHRALQAAADRRHEYATLEHLLIALLDDPEASTALSACGADIENIRRDVSKYLDEELEALRLPIADLAEHASRDEQSQNEEVLPFSKDEVESEGSVGVQPVKPPTPEEYDRDGPSPTSGFQRTVQRAILHVKSSGRDEVSGVNVLVALFSESESYAVHFLHKEDVSRLDIVSYISYGFTGRKGSFEEENSPTVGPSVQTVARDKRLNRIFKNDLTALSDAVPIEPVLHTPSVATKIVDFVMEIWIQKSLVRKSAEVTDPLVTIGLYGPWGSGKSTLLAATGARLAKEGFVTVYINTWRWNGTEDIYSFINRELLSSLTKQPGLRLYAWAIRTLLYLRTKSKTLTIVSGFVIASILCWMLIDWEAIKVPPDLFSKKSALVALLASLAAIITKPAGAAIEKFLLRNKTQQNPGDDLSTSYRYLQLTKAATKQRSKPIAFLFDDLDRCQDLRSVDFMRSIHSIVLGGSIAIIACDDRFLSSAVHSAYKSIADLTENGHDFGKRFLEKIVQLHFRMPDIMASDLHVLGLAGSTAKVDGQTELPDRLSDAPDRSSTSQAPMGKHEDAEGRIRALAEESGETVSEVALSQITGEMLSEMVEPYRLQIRQAKMLTNLVKLYTMVFPPTTEESAYRLIAFLLMTYVDPDWIPREFFDVPRPDRTSRTALPPQVVVRRYLGEDRDAILKLYSLCGLARPSSH